MSSCGRAFGEFCDGVTQAFTDGRGVAQVAYTLTQADLDFCNCLPSDPVCSLFCPTPGNCSAQPTCPPSGDLFCQVAFSAQAGATPSRNVAYLEYGR